MHPLKRFYLTPVVAVVALVVLAAPALAQVAEDGNVSPDAPVSAWLTVNNTLVVLLTGALLPLLNGLLLRPENAPWVKGLVANIVATAAHAFTQAIQDDGTAVLSQEWLLGLALVIISMAASYFQVWKPIVDPNRTLPTVLPALPSDRAA